MRRIIIINILVLCLAGCVDTSKYGVNLSKSEKMREDFKSCSELKQPYPYKGKVNCYINGVNKFEVNTK